MTAQEIKDKLEELEIGGHEMYDVDISEFFDGNIESNEREEGEEPLTLEKLEEIVGSMSIVSKFEALDGVSYDESADMWVVVHFEDHNVFLKWTGWHNEFDEDWYDGATEVFPVPITTIAYKTKYEIENPE